MTETERITRSVKFTQKSGLSLIPIELFIEKILPHLNVHETFIFAQACQSRYTSQRNLSSWLRDQIIKKREIDLVHEDELKEEASQCLITQSYFSSNHSIGSTKTSWGSQLQLFQLLYTKHQRDRQLKFHPRLYAEIKENYEGSPTEANSFLLDRYRHLRLPYKEFCQSFNLPRFDNILLEEGKKIRQYQPSLQIFMSTQLYQGNYQTGCLAQNLPQVAMFILYSLYQSVEADQLLECKDITGADLEDIQFMSTIPTGFIAAPSNIVPYHQNYLARPCASVAEKRPVTFYTLLVPNLLQKSYHDQNWTDAISPQILNWYYNYHGDYQSHHAQMYRLSQQWRILHLFASQRYRYPDNGRTPFFSAHNPDEQHIDVVRRIFGAEQLKYYRWVHKIRIEKEEEFEKYIQIPHEISGYLKHYCCLEILIVKNFPGSGLAKVDGTWYDTFVEEDKEIQVYSYVTMNPVLTVPHGNASQETTIIPRLKKTRHNLPGPDHKWHSLIMSEKLFIYETKFLVNENIDTQRPWYPHDKSNFGCIRIMRGNTMIL